MKIVAISILMSAVFGAAHAAELSLPTPLAAKTLHEGGVDMTLYWQKNGDLAEVTTFYVASNRTFEPKRVVLALADGEAVSFALPDARQVFCQFSRTGDVIDVSATRIWQDLAATQ